MGDRQWEQLSWTHLANRSLAQSLRSSGPHAQLPDGGVPAPSRTHYPFPSHPLPP